MKRLDTDLSTETTSVVGLPVIPPGGRFVIEPEEKITLGHGDVALLESVERALAAGARRILIRFKTTSRLDTFGLNALIAANERVVHAGATLTLLDLPTRVREILELAQCGCSRAIGVNHSVGAIAS